MYRESGEGCTGTVGEGVQGQQGGVYRDSRGGCTGTAGECYRDGKDGVQGRLLSKELKPHAAAWQTAVSDAGTILVNQLLMHAVLVRITAKQSTRRGWEGCGR